MNEIFIETSRLILRQWKETDLEPFAQLNMDNDVMGFFPSVLAKEETLVLVNRVTKHIKEYGFGLFAAERKDNNQFIGFTGLSHPRFESHFTPCVEIGWRLSKENWNQGFATEAAKACLQFGFDTLKLSEIYSFTTVSNFRSENVMKKIGMIKEGYFEHPSVEDGHILKKHVLYKTCQH
ncbi:MAG: ribosomal-protein-S5-alanine N-acetyltransferase [Mucilaginibacter sp.]|nr:ribosomal-protein-S5-alanine N-acetyltransferase [Mucilaginibacter sp.]